MKKQYPVWLVSLFFALVMIFVISGWDYIRYHELMGLPSGIIWFVFMFVMGLVWVTVDRQEDKGEFKITGWKCIFYFIGFLGFINVLFWLMAYTACSHKAKKTKKEVRFFGSQFHSLVFTWGVLMSLLALAVFLLIKFGW